MLIFLGCAAAALWAALAVFALLLAAVTVTAWALSKAVDLVLGRPRLYPRPRRRRLR